MTGREAFLKCSRHFHAWFSWPFGCSQVLAPDPSQSNLPLPSYSSLLRPPLRTRLKPLLDHKNKIGNARRIPLDGSGAQVGVKPGGGNDAEKLKLAIYNHWLAGTQYVMLVGDMSLVPCWPKVVVRKLAWQPGCAHLALRLCVIRALL